MIILAQLVLLLGNLYYINFFDSDKPVSTTAAPAEEQMEAQTPHRFSLGIAPFTMRKINDEKEINVNTSYGYEVEAWSSSFEVTRVLSSSTSTDIETGALLTVKRATTEMELNFDIKRLTPWLNYFFQASYNREREQEKYIKRHEFRGGPVGFKFIIFRDELITKFDLSYIPLYEMLDEDIEETIEDPVTFESTIVLKRRITRNLRNAFRLEIESAFLEGGKFTINNTMNYRPIYRSDTGELDYEDADFSNEFTAAYKLSENFEFSYVNNYSWDIRRRINESPATEFEHSFNLTFNHIW